MAGSSPKIEEGKKKARIEIIPLIDVIFFLLATFVLFTLSLKRLVSIPVQLPVAQAEAQSKPDLDMITLQMSDQGACYWKQGSGQAELITVAELMPRLEDYQKRVANPRVLITGDTRAKFGAVVLALDQVRKSGIQQVSVDTRQPRASGQ